MFTPQEAINRLCDKREIFYDEMVDLMRQVMEGKVPPVQLAAILMGLHVKTESVSEIAAYLLELSHSPPTIQDLMKARPHQLILHL